MKPLRAISAFVGIFIFFGFLNISPGAHAEETFSTTVKIVSYRQLLNGFLSPMAEGSGTIISNEGDIVTNSHVVMNDSLNKPFDAFSICVSETPQKAPECRFTASLVRMEKKIDLAQLKINPVVAWGTSPVSFPFLDYKMNLDPKESDKVTVRGFSASGGVTMNTTQGQISGFEEFNGYNYLKTDADIDAGNSGGTMLDSNGNFIGIPTYVVSYYETAGRALNISEVKKWLELPVNDPLKPNTAGIQKLSEDLKRFHDAETSKQLRYAVPPGLSFTLPEGWLFKNIAEDGFLIIQKDNDNGYIQGRLQKDLFKLDLTPEERLKKIRQDIGEESYPNEKIISVNGNEAFDFSQTSIYGAQHFIVLPHGYNTLLLDYFIPKGYEDSVKTGIDSFLSTVKFSSPDQDNPAPKVILEEKTYPFSLQVFNGWRIEKENDSEGRLALAGRRIKGKESLKIHYGELPQGASRTTPKEGLKYDLENYVPVEAKINFKSSDLVVDGLKGWIIFYEYGAGNQKTKVASATIMDPKYEFYFDYEADEANFDEGVKAYLFALKHFKSKRYDDPVSTWGTAIDPTQKGVYKIPDAPASSMVVLTDIAGHRFEQNILNLVQMGVINGNPDGTFRPEDQIDRAATLKIILQALRAKQASQEESPYVMPSNFGVFPDVSTTDWFATYVAEGLNKGIIAGHPDGTFKPAYPVNLAEALKMAEEAYKVKVWSGQTEPWYKKYIDAAYELDILPRGLEDPGKLLTRAELAYLVDRLITNY